jgi:hypothetical protein
MDERNIKVKNKVYIYKLVNGKYKKRGLFSVEDIGDRMIRFRKIPGGYAEAINITDLRQRLYILYLEDGAYIQFRGMVDMKKYMVEKEKEKFEEIKKEKGNRVMATMTKEIVKKMSSEGMSVAQIADHFTDSYPRMQAGILKAKITMLLSDKKAKRTRKVEQEGANTDIVIADEVATTETSATTSTHGKYWKQLPSFVEATSAINSHEEHPQTVESAAAEIKELAEIVDKQVTEAARKAAEKIIYASEGEIINYKKPVKYYIATGYLHKDRAEQLGEILKAAGGEITCEWWLNVESGDLADFAEIGKIEFQGIIDCDVFVCLMPGYLGTHTEIGAAAILNKKVIIHDVNSASIEKVVPCYYLKNVKWISGSELQLMAELLTHTA